MVSFPNAKINIGLNITEKRPDGYHNIETIFYPIGLCDKLSFEIAKGDETSLSISGIKIDGDPNDNLIRSSAWTKPSCPKKTWPSAGRA